VKSTGIVILGFDAAFIGASCRAESSLDVESQPGQNNNMEIQGTVQNGVIVLDDVASLPEGARVVVLTLEPLPPNPLSTKRRVQLPLVTNGEPGGIQLTNERIYEILDEEDGEAVKRSWNAPS